MYLKLYASVWIEFRELGECSMNNIITTGMNLRGFLDELIEDSNGHGSTEKAAFNNLE